MPLSKPVTMSESASDGSDLWFPLTTVGKGSCFCA